MRHTKQTRTDVLLLIKNRDDVSDAQRSAKQELEALDGMLPWGNGYTIVFASGNTCAVCVSNIKELSFWGRRAQFELKPQ
jgi:hypothetical protein